MKKSMFLLAFVVTALLITLTGCQVIGGIFKAGVWSGIAIVVIVIALIAYIISRGSKNE
ncbi:MAG TPA: hypothetical protein VK718_03480 [Ferruginibacter sp.]|nr:hypothetical protein [Ferruginibacter sp.]